jgi:hypothetical protein
VVIAIVVTRRPRSTPGQVPGWRSILDEHETSLFDGGRISAALHPRLWFAGLLALLALVVYQPNPILILILLLAVSELRRRWQTRRARQMQDYYRVRPHQRLLMGLLHFGSQPRSLSACTPLTCHTASERLASRSARPRGPARLAPESRRTIQPVATTLLRAAGSVSSSRRESKHNANRRHIAVRPRDERYYRAD